MSCYQLTYNLQGFLLLGTKYWLLKCVSQHGLHSHMTLCFYFIWCWVLKPLFISLPQTWNSTQFRAVHHIWKFTQFLAQIEFLQMLIIHWYIRSYNLWIVTHAVHLTFFTILNLCFSNTVPFSMLIINNQRNIKFSTHLYCIHVYFM